MRKNDPIKHIMSDAVHSVQQGQTVSAAVKIINDENIHHIPVLDGEKLVGIVSSTDLTRLSMGSLSVASVNMWSYLDTQHRLADVMTTDPQTLSENSVVRDAAHSLSTGQYHSLPVVDATKKLVGIVTSTDLIRYLCDQY